MSAAPAGLRRRPSPPALALAVILGIVILVPAIVAGVAITRPQWFPTGDMAQAELHVRGFWSHPPLVGAAGRIQSSAGVQGSHPGPLLWLAMWPLYALGGSTTTALVASIVTVHIVTAILALWLAWRAGGAGFAVSLAATLAVIVRAGGPDVFTEPWNPWMGLLPFLVFLLASTLFLDGERWTILLAVAAGSYSLQAHTGYALVVAGLLTFVMVVAVVRAARAPAEPPTADRRSAVLRMLAWIGAAVALGVVLWIPPLLDQLGREPGNMSILRDNFSHPDQPYLGLGEVARISVVQLNVLGPWLLGPGRLDVTWYAVLGFVAFVALWVAAVLAARRRRAARELSLHAVLAVATALAVVSISRIFGLYLEYTVRWVWLIAGTVVAASVVSLWRSRPRLAASPGWAALAGGAIVAAMAIVGSVQFAGSAGPTGAIDSRIVGGLAPEVQARLDPDAAYLVRWWDPTVLGATGFGLALELERRGYHVGVDRQFAAAALPHRVLPEEQADAVLYVVVGTPAIERARAIPGVVELASFDVRSPEERRRSDELREQLERSLSDSGHADRIPLIDAQYGLAQLMFADPPLPEDVTATLDEYIALRQPTAVFQAPPITPVLPLG